MNIDKLTRLAQGKIFDEHQTSADFDWYLENQDSLVAEYDGKCLAIKDKAIIGVFDEFWEAVDETDKKHKPGTFIVQRCSPGIGDYTTFITIPVITGGVEGGNLTRYLGDIPLIKKEYFVGQTIK